MTRENDNNFITWLKEIRNQALANMLNEEEQRVDKNLVEDYAEDRIRDRADDRVEDCVERHVEDRPEDRVGDPVGDGIEDCVGKHVEDEGRPQEAKIEGMAEEELEEPATVEVEGIADAPDMEAEETSEAQADAAMEQWRAERDKWRAEKGLSPRRRDASKGIVRKRGRGRGRGGLSRQP